MTWELVSAQIPTIITVIVGILWNDRRVTRIERDVHWLTKTMTHRTRATNDDEQQCK